MPENPAIARPAGARTHRHGGHPRPHPDLSRHVPLILLLAYIGLVIYSSLYPFHGWIFAGKDPLHFVFQPVLRWSRADVLVNFISYIPLGLLIVWNLSRRWLAGSVLLGVIGGTTLSFAMEALQTFNPSRTSSRGDLEVNAIGCLAGALLGAATYRVRGSERFLHWYRGWVRPTRAAQAALAITAMWVLTQWSPLVPAFDVSSFRHALRPLYLALHGQGRLPIAATLVNAFQIAAVCILLCEALHSARPRRIVAAAVVIVTLAIKPFFFSRMLGIEHVLGLLLGLLLFVLLQDRNFSRIAAAMMLAAAYGISELTPARGVYHPFNWVPFAGEFVNSVNGFQQILEQTWPFAAICALSYISRRDQRRSMLIGLAGVALIAYVLGVEAMQTQIPGRYADITNVILAAAGWIVTWLWCRPQRHSGRSRRHSHRRSRRPAAPLAPPAPSTSE